MRAHEKPNSYQYLEKDPGEMKNVAADPAYASVLAQHRRFMREWVEANHDKLAASYIIQE